jgi:hypothetical protein
MKSVLLVFILLLVTLSPALAQADVSGLWVSDFYGNRVECHIEQRGQFLYGVAYVTTRTGERNTYHVAGLVQGRHIRAQHGGGNYFEGDVEGADQVSGTFYMKNGPSIAMQAERIKRGQTVPGGLEWPPGYPPAQ